MLVEATLICQFLCLTVQNDRNIIVLIKRIWKKKMENINALEF